MSNGLRDDINIWPSSAMSKRPMPTKIKIRYGSVTVTLEVDAPEVLPSEVSREIQGLASKIAHLASPENHE